MRVSLLLAAAALAASHRSRAGIQADAQAITAPNFGGSFISVLDYGASVTSSDNTAAFQAALNAAAGVGGGIVFVPAGNWTFTGTLAVPAATALVGTYQSIAAHPVGQGKPWPGSGQGSVLQPRAGRNNASAPAFVTLSDNAQIKGFTIYYPDVAPDQVPVPYPYTIVMAGTNPAVLDVELLNCWNGIYAVQAPRHYIARVQGQPANIGIFVDQTYDIGRIENVHWNPWFSDNANYISWQTTQGVGFLIARTDWEYVLNTFVFSMSIGYKFVESTTGSCNGNFVGIGADCCANASVWVDSADPWGILITNGEFTSFSGSFGPDVADHTQVVVTSSNTGSVRFTNSAFWGPSNQIAKINGTGTVAFDSCIFNHWDAVKQNRSAIQVYGGNAQIRGNDFQFSHPQLLVADGAKKVIFTDNLIAGPLSATNANGAKTVIANNLSDD